MSARVDAMFPNLVLLRVQGFRSEFGSALDGVDAILLA